VTTPPELWDQRARAAMRAHFFLLVPPLVALAWLLLTSERIWIDRNATGRTGSSSMLAAHQALGLAAICIALYLVAPLAKHLPTTNSWLRPSAPEPSEAEVGCVVVMLRALVLLLLYWATWGFWKHY
jgi:hypothetical protein